MESASQQFEEHKVQQRLWAQLKPQAVFHDQTIFGKRAHDDWEEKSLIGYFVGYSLVGTGISVFITDGSSTFYICKAIALRCLEQRGKAGSLHFITNNMAISTELDAWPQYPGGLSLSLIGGKKDFDLNATFPDRWNESNKEFVQQVSMAIVSVRELSFRDGPTSPDQPSRLLKREVFRLQVPLVIALNWQKLAQAHYGPNLGERVFADRSEWERVKQDKELCIICNKPTTFNGNTWERGRSLETSRFGQEGDHWTDLSLERQIDRYCWHVFKLSYYSKFIEVHST